MAQACATAALAGSPPGIVAQPPESIKTATGSRVTSSHPESTRHAEIIVLGLQRGCRLAGTVTLRAFPEEPGRPPPQTGYIDVPLVLPLMVDILEKLEDWYWRGSSWSPIELPSLAARAALRQVDLPLRYILSCSDIPESGSDGAVRSLQNQITRSGPFSAVTNHM